MLNETNQVVMNGHVESILQGHLHHRKSKINEKKRLLNDLNFDHEQV